MNILKATHVTAIATEVFRISPNGGDVIKSFENILGAPIKVVTP